MPKSHTSVRKPKINKGASAATRPVSTSGSASGAERRPEPQPNYLLTAALFYHGIGLPITLCQGKAPWHQGWPDIVWTPERIESAYRIRGGSNVGALIGRRSGLVDFDCDGPEAEQTLKELFGGDIPETATWRSRRGNHRLFKWHPALDQLGKSKLVLGNAEAKLEILIGPNVQTLLPPSWSDGVQREWISGEQLLPDRVASIPDHVLVKLGCDLATPVLAGSPALLNTDSIPTSVVSVVSVVSVLGIDEGTSQRIQAAIERCTVRAAGTTNAKFMSLAIALKGMPELERTMGEDLEPFIRRWYEESLPCMSEKDWKAVWERWLYLWVWAQPGHDVVRLAFEAAQQEPLPQCALGYPLQTMRQLVGLCRMLQRRHADERGVWYLSSRLSGEMLEVGHTLAAKLLKILVRDEILEIVEPHTAVKAPRYRYHGGD